MPGSGLWRNGDDMRSPFPEPLRDPRFRTLFLGRTVSLFGDNLVPVALAFAVLDLTGSASDLGLVLAVQTVSMVAFLLVGGIWGDRVARNRLMVASDLVRAGVQALVVVVLVSGQARACGTSLS